MKMNDENSGARVVEVRVEELVIPTYMPAPPDKNPMFLEKRVYQGSQGKVYPLPFTDRINEKPVERKWQAIWIENEYIRALVLPEIGGRIHALQDKTNGYDVLYNQHVIKPALVGLAGPWISGGIEFNWPQHHRPATFLPVDFAIEEEADGSKTVWCSDHEPMARMKGMHGICLRPGKAYLELKVRAYNRTPHMQTFLWWANVATRVHESYQSFFPPDVYYVADHARRSMSEYPCCRSRYYGVNYGERARKGVAESERPKKFIPTNCGGRSVTDYAANDLSFYANIPVPTSYMCMGSKEDFFGGYDYAAQAGIVHYANHHISPGKKQWTWGNHEFGYAWDRNLTDPDKHSEYGPYIEIMAGVYTDNQPDFSFLQPGETKTWSQYWYPIQKIGPAQHANLEAAISLKTAGKDLHIGVAVTSSQSEVTLKMVAADKQILFGKYNITPAQPLLEKINLPKGIKETDLFITAVDKAGRELISYRPRKLKKNKVPSAASEPSSPAEISSSDELYVTGVHLDQYRHATRCPTDYWREALRRDPLDSRANNAMGLWHLKRGEFEDAEKYFRNAIARLTLRNANPRDGEAYYNLGLCLRFALNEMKLDSKKDESSMVAVWDEAYGAFYKASWNQAWAGASFHKLAEMDCEKQHWLQARAHIDQSLRLNIDNLRARNLRVMILRKLDMPEEASRFLLQTLELDRLDWWARHLNGEQLTCDLQTLLDIAYDYSRAGFFAEAIDLLKRATSAERDLPDQSLGALPMMHYLLGWLEARQDNFAVAMKEFEFAANVSADYCFPARLEEIAVLRAAMHFNPADALAPYYLGNLFYDRRRHKEAIKCWEQSVKLKKNFSIAWRNLGIGYFNILGKPQMARAAFEKAFAAAHATDARLLFERDQLWKRLGEKPEKRLRELEKYRRLVEKRDDLTIELCALYNQTGRYDEARELLRGRQFQPWEGGEGAPLAQHVTAHIALGRMALAGGDFKSAQAYFSEALESPTNLSEAKHLLANQSDIHYWLGVACAALGDKKRAREEWLLAATCKGDFQEMSVRSFSEMTYYSALSLQKLGKRNEANKLLHELLAYARKLEKSEANIDYFATSLPTMLLFDDDLKYRQKTTALFLRAQATLGLGNIAAAKKLLNEVQKRDPNAGYLVSFLALL